MELLEGIAHWLRANVMFLLIGVIPVAVIEVARSVSVRSLRFKRAAGEETARARQAGKYPSFLSERVIEHECVEAWIALNAPRVAWKIENIKGALYVLRNVGTAPAEDMTMPEELLSGIPKRLPDGVVVWPGEKVEFYLFEKWGSPAPRTVYLRWRGQDDLVALPVP